MRSAKIVEVIVTVSLEGEGVEGDPCREITRYWTKDGNLIAEKDPVNKSE